MLLERDRKRRKSEGAPRQRITMEIPDIRLIIRKISEKQNPYQVLNLTGVRSLASEHESRSFPASCYFIFSHISSHAVQEKIDWNTFRTSLVMWLARHRTITDNTAQHITRNIHTISWTKDNLLHYPQWQRITDRLVGKSIPNPQKQIGERIL